MGEWANCLILLRVERLASNREVEVGTKLLVVIQRGENKVEDSEGLIYRCQVHQLYIIRHHIADIENVI